jgi:mannosyl-oligosaccharide alpha-1,2-mannosidase
VKDAMKFTFEGYRSKAWKFDDILPVSGGHKNTRNAWGAFIIDSSTTLTTMGMWAELSSGLNFIQSEVDFRMADGLVDPFETTIRYLGAMVSLVELGDAGIIPNNLMSAVRRSGILKKSSGLANSILRAFDTRTSLPWPRIDFVTGLFNVDEKAIGPARAGTNFLELCTLSKLTEDPIYCSKATQSWASLVRNHYIEELPGLLDGRISLETGAPVGLNRSWDSGHDSYYEYLLKANLLLPHSQNAKIYRDRWLQAAQAVRSNLTSRSAATPHHFMSHLYLGKWSGPWYINEMSHLGFFAPGTLLLGGRHLQRPDLVVLGQAILEGARHVYKSTPTGLAPEVFSWEPASGTRNGTFDPQTEQQRQQLNQNGFWVVDPRYKLRPEYAESLFYAFRTTGEKRYRDWAWDVFLALEAHCKTTFGYAGLQDVMNPKSDKIDHTESYFAAETLKYLYLIFEDVSVLSLDEWIFTTEGHLVRRGR